MLVPSRAREARRAKASAGHRPPKGAAAPERLSVLREVMQRGAITVSPTATVSQVMQLMTRHRIRHMPVLRDGKLAGIISVGDVVKLRLDDLELENNVLRDA